LHTNLYPALAGFAVFSSLFGENEKLGGAVTDFAGL
jgi:hypothetical protein